MSVVNECLKGDIIYNIIEYWIEGNENSINDIIYEKRKLEIGENLEFIDAYFDEKYKNTPYAWQILFRCSDGCLGNAPQINFITEDEWNDLKEYFKEYFRSFPI